jgi:rRNA maturation RNase YbeY
MASKSKVYFFYQQTGFAFESRNSLKQYIESIFRGEGKRLSSLNYIFCSDTTLLEVNKRFLRHDYYTDIITFDLSESNTIVAEVYISIDRVKDNARSLGVSFKSELHRVIFHGALHLCGFGDKTKPEKARMREKEDYLLNIYFKRK